MLSRDSEEDFEDDIEGLGVASAQETGQQGGESSSEVTSSKEDVKGTEGYEHNEGQSPTQPKLRDNVT